MGADWAKVRHVFEEALDRAPEARGAFLDEACGADAALRREVDALLGAHERPGAFLAGAAAIPSTPASASTTPMSMAEWLRSGAVVDGKYLIEQLLGSGGMGSVYRARHLQLERPVALKVIRSDRLSDRSIAERFRRE